MLSVSVSAVSEQHMSPIPFSGRQPGPFCAEAGMLGLSRWASLALLKSNLFISSCRGVGSPESQSASTSAALTSAIGAPLSSLSDLMDCICPLGAAACRLAALWIHRPPCKSLERSFSNDIDEDVNDLRCCRPSTAPLHTLWCTALWS